LPALSKASELKHYIQYHNTEKAGQLVAGADDSFVATSLKPIRKVVGQQMWLISGQGKPRNYQLECTFRVDEVIEGTPSRAIGTTGKRCVPPIPLSGRPWFDQFVLDQQQFSLGVREIQPEALVHFQAIAAQIGEATSSSDPQAALDQVDALTTADYVQALTAIESRMSAPQRAMLIGHGAAAGAGLSMGALAEIGGYDGYKSANVQYGRLAGLLAEASGIQGLAQKTQMLAVPHPNANADGHWQWTLRPQLLDALWGLWPEELLEATPEAAVAAAEVDRDPKCEGISRTERAALIQARIGQGAYRKDLLNIWGGRCAVSGCSLAPVLVASHAKAWKHSSNQERLDPHNGLLLAASIDRLFDRGWISFDDQGRMLVSGSVSDEDLSRIGLDRTARLAGMTGRHRPYLRHHRQTNGYSE
jgi:hypothetical protein